MQNSKKSLTELFIDSEEVGELLQVYGIEPPEKKQTKQRLEQLLAQIGEEQLLASLFELASGFALMTQEIFGLAQEAGVGIQGQILLPTQGTPLAFAALDSDWAFSSAAPINTNIDERANALIGRLSGIVETLDPNQLIQNATETRETSLGRSLRVSPAPEARALRPVLRSAAERTRHYKAFSEVDRRGVTIALNALNEARAHLSGVPLPAGLKATLDELEIRCQAALDVMAQAKAGEGKANPMVSTLADEIQIASIRLQELAEEAAEAERAEGGLRDFLKSDFWFQRWRIYELWVLCRVLRTLQNMGGKMTFRRVIDGIWHLKYGRDTEPIATCEIGGRHLDIYYQLYRTDEEASEIPDEKAADMPDIAVFERTSESTTGGDSELGSLGRAVAVIDPKHGLSFYYKKVDEVLTRYAQQFQADLTAVVNYYPMRSYPFNLSMLRDKRLILASGVAPNSVSSRRLELSLEDTLLSRNLASLKPIAEQPKIKPERRRAEAGVLLYLAKHAIEVDEPAGLWILSERGGVVPAPRLDNFSDQEIEWIDATHDGEACLLRTSQHLVWLVDKRKLRVLEKPDDLLFSIGWNPTGTHFAAASRNGLRVWKRDGSDFALIPFPDGTNLLRPAVGWDATGDAVILGVGVSKDYSSTLSLIRLDLSGYQTLLNTWPGKSSSDIDLTVIPLGPQEGTLVHSKNLGNMLVTHTDAQQWNKSDAPLSVSPSGNYRVFDGPQSIRREGDFHLLRLEMCNDQATQLPLVRFRGGITNSIKWSLDESRFAFLVSRENAGNRRRINTLMYVRPGDRYAEAVSLPGQNPESLYAFRGWPYKARAQGSSASFCWKLTEFWAITAAVIPLRENGLPHARVSAMVTPFPLPEGLQLDPTHWDETPVAVQEVVIHLLAVIRQQEERMRTLEARIAALEARGLRNSGNSDRPPSSDPPWVKPKTPSEPKGTPGARPGHPGHHQVLLEPTEVIAVRPPACGCGQTAFPDARPYYTHQVIELPDIQMIVRHFVLYEANCSRCGKVTKAPVPPVASSGYGPRFTALLGELSGSQRSSRSAVQEFCRSVLGVPISQGAIQRAVDRVSEALNPYYEAIAVQARRAPVNYIDETGWYQHGVLAWLWVMVNTTVALFKVQASRSHAAFEALSAHWAGILVSDGYAVYQHWVHGRQTCLAHLIRRARGLAERQEPELAQFGSRVLTELQRLVHWAHAPPTAGAVQTWYARLVHLLNQHRLRKDEAGTLARTLERELGALWTFVVEAGVEPTNNRAERALRFAVLWRKMSQGTYNEKGDRWVERILSLRETCRLRGIPMFPILVEAVNCYFNGRHPDVSWI